MILPTAATVALILLLVAVLVVGLVKIIAALESIGGTSLALGKEPALLAKARWGVRAIERQTAALEPEVMKLDNGLGALDATLTGLAERFGRLLAAVERQGQKPLEGGAP